MTDRPDFLDDLENQLLDAVPALRRRRRRRRALAGVAGASLIVAAGLLATALFDDPRDGPEDVVAVSPTTTISGTAATGAPTTTQSPSPPGDSYAVGGPVVGFGPDGVVAQEAPGVTAGITPRPAARAHVFDTGLVAYQLAGDDGADGYPLTPDGPIVLERPDGETTTIEPEPGRELALLDAAVINDRATLLATSRVSGSTTSSPGR